MADERIKDIATEATSFEEDHFAELDGATNGSKKMRLGRVLAAQRNALGPRGGVAFDGTSSSRVYAALTGYSIGTEPFSIVVGFKVPNSQPTTTGGICVLSSSATTVVADNAFEVSLGGNILSVTARLNAAGSEYASWSWNGFHDAYAGKWVLLAVVRGTSGNAVIYANGVDISARGSFSSAGSGSWQQSVTSTFFDVGFTTASNVAVWPIYCASIYNLPLTAGEVLEIYELNGAVPERFKFGSQSELVTNGDFSSATGWTAETGWSIGSGVATATAAGPTATVGRGDVSVTRGKRYRIDFEITSYTSGAVRGYVSSTAGAGTNRSAVGVYSEVVTCPTTSGSAGLNVQTAFDGVCDNFSVKQVGAVGHWSLDEGIGYQLHDESTNKLDAAMTTTGVAHIIPKRRGYVRTPGAGLSWSATHEAKSLLGVAQAALPSGAVIERITTKATAGSSGSGLAIGSTNSAGRYVAANTFTTAKENHTLANTLPAGSAANDLDLIIDPDTSNYTGTIAAEVHYAVTEGAP